MNITKGVVNKQKESMNNRRFIRFLRKDTPGKCREGWIPPVHKLSELRELP